MESDNSSICGPCIINKPPFDKLISVFSYGKISKKLIHQFKFSDNIQSTNFFVELMIKAGKEIIEEADYVVPIPLHKVRLLKRKYNQAALLSNKLSKTCNKTSIPNALIRKINTPPQTSLSKKERLKNVKGVFSVNESFTKKVEGKNILLIDDVMTTGSTLNECSKLLKKSKAKKVFIITLARTINN